MSTKEGEEEEGEYEGMWTELDSAACQMCPHHLFGSCQNIGTGPRSINICKCSSCSPLWLSFQRPIPSKNTITSNKYCCSVWVYLHKYKQDFSYSSFKIRNKYVQNSLYWNIYAQSEKVMGTFLVPTVSVR